MYYFPYRYYSPMMNRWTAADPLGLVDGPNVYGYVRGNPVVHIDPTGQFGPFYGIIGLGVGFKTGGCLENVRYKAFKAHKTKPGWYSQHCVFGCYLAKCMPMPRMASASFAYVLDWTWEKTVYIFSKITAWRKKNPKLVVPHDPDDDRAAFYGAYICSGSKCSCEDCCNAYEKQERQRPR